MEHIDDFGNPSSSHELGRQARVLIEDAREKIAKCINANPNNIYFTSGGSEANSWAMYYSLLKEEVTEKSGVQTSGFTEKVEEISRNVMTEKNKVKAKKILKIIGIILAVVLAIDIISMILYFSV